MVQARSHATIAPAISPTRRQGCNRCLSERVFALPRPAHDEMRNFVDRCASTRTCDGRSNAHLRGHAEHV